MPDVSGGIHSDLDWSWDFTLGCDTSARGTSRSECRIGFIYGSEEHQPLDSQIWPVKNNRGKDIMLKDSKAFSGFSTGDIPKTKEFYSATLAWTLRNLTASSRCTSPVATMFSFIQSPTIFRPPLPF